MPEPNERSRLPIKGKILGDPRIIVGGRRARIEDDGTFTRYTQPSAAMRKQAGRKASAQAKKARRTNRGR